MNYKHHWGCLLLLIVFWLPLSAQQEENPETPTRDTTGIPEEFRQQYARWQHAQALDLIMSQDYEEALKKLNGVIDMAEDGAAYYNRGVVYHFMGEHARATEDFGRAIALDPRPEYFYARGIEHLEHGDTMAALPDLQRSLAGDTSDGSCRMLIGGIFLNTGRFSESTEMFRKVVEMNPDHPEAIAGWGIALLRQKDTAAIGALMDQLVEDHPAKGVLSAAMGYVWYMEQRYEEARGAITEAIEHGISEVSAINTLAIIYLHLGHLDSAQHYCEMAMGADLQYAPSWNTRGVLNIKLKDYTKAETDLTMAITLQPTYAEAWYNRAYCREMMRNDAGACEDLVRAVALDLPEAKPYREAICR